MTKDEAIEVLREALGSLLTYHGPGIYDVKKARKVLSDTATIAPTSEAVAEKPQDDRNAASPAAPAFQDGAAASGWISVDERLPDDSGDVLVLYWPYDNHENAQIAGQAHYHDGGFYNDDGDDWHPPSHWMPLPPAPGASSLPAGSAREGGNTNAELSGNSGGFAQPAADPDPVPAQGIDRAKRAEDEHAAYVAWVNKCHPESREHVTAWNGWLARGQQGGVPECPSCHFPSGGCITCKSYGFFGSGTRCFDCNGTGRAAAAPGEAG